MSDAKRGRFGPASNDRGAWSNLSPERFRADLLRWFDTEKRDLPWRHTRNPYDIWVSEVMLQQTRVEVVIPRYLEFLERFPSPEALASASEEAVLSLWSGLGYYSRARHLRQGAALVTERYGGAFPGSREAAMALPGVGSYTAAAVLSIGYGTPLPVVDGNVARVLARLWRLDPPQDRAQKALEALAGHLLDPSRPGDHNQAMMELGALVCVPGTPRCAGCPVSTYCRARRDGVAELYPRGRAPTTPLDLQVRVLLGRDTRGRLLLQRGGWRLLRELWIPPVDEIMGEFVGERAGRSGGDHGRASAPERDDESAPARPPRIARALREASWREIGTFRHAITRHRILGRVLLAVIRPGPGRLPPGYRLATDADLTGLGRSSLLEKALRLEEKAQ